MRQRDTTAAAAEPLYEVRFRSGKVYTLTQAQLDANPQLKPYASLKSDVLEQDFAEDPHPGRLPSSSRRYFMPEMQAPPRIEDRGTLPRRAHREIEDIPRKAERQRRGGLVGFLRGYPKVSILLGMAFMVVIAWSIGSLSAWWTLHQQDVTYGRPRTFQIDAVVGHNDSPNNPSHFLFLNLNRHVVIIELPGGDTSKARIYTGPTLFGDGQELTPITAEFKDVNGDGRPDMVVHIQDQTLVYLNDGTQFVPLRPGQPVNVGG